MKSNLVPGVDTSVTLPSIVELPFPPPAVTLPETQLISAIVDSKEPLVPLLEATETMSEKASRSQAMKRLLLAKMRSQIGFRQSRSRGPRHCKVPAYSSKYGGWTCPPGHILFKVSDDPTAEPCCVPLHKVDATISEQMAQADDRLDLLEELVLNESLSVGDRRIAAHQAEQINYYVGELMLEQEMLCYNLSPDDCRASQFCELSKGWWSTTCHGRNLKKLGIHNFYNMGTKVMKLATEKMDLEIKSLEERTSRQDRQRLAFFRALQVRMGEQIEIIYKAVALEKALNDRIDEIRHQIQECSQWLSAQGSKGVLERMTQGPSLCTPDRKRELERLLLEALKDRERDVAGFWRGNEHKYMTWIFAIVVLLAIALILSKTAGLAKAAEGVVKAITGLAETDLGKEFSKNLTSIIRFGVGVGCVAGPAAAGALVSGPFALVGGAIGGIGGLVACMLKLK